MSKGAIAMALLCPAVVFMCDQLVQQSLGFVASALGDIDTSRDWSEDRFYSVYAHDLERRVQSVSMVAVLPLTIVSVSVIGAMRKVGVATAAARAFAGLLGGVPAFASLAVLLGAPIVVAQYKTLALAALLAALATVPLAVALGSDAEGWRRVVCANAPRDEAERVALFCAGGAVLGAWLGALPIPLDWDRHWQTWPITPAVGAVAAASLALPLAALVSAARPFAGGASRRKRE